jgi:hypothetical protein
MGVSETPFLMLSTEYPLADYPGDDKNNYQNDDRHLS